MRPKFLGADRQQRSASASRALAGLIFLVLMVGTMVAVTAHLGRPARTNDAPVREMAKPIRRTQQHKDALVKEAQSLLSAIETAESRIDAVAKLLAQLPDQRRQQAGVGQPNAGGLVEFLDNGEDDSGARSQQQHQEQQAFPLSRFEQLKQRHEGTGRHPYRDNAARASASVAEYATIFVGIASHRHTLCSAMVSNLFRHAQFPRRVYLGIVEIRRDKDPLCIPEQLSDCQLSEFCPTDHTRIRQLDPAENKGLAFARSLVALMYRGQSYVLFAAVPTFFAVSWDTSLVIMAVEAARDAAERGSTSAASGSGGVIITTSPEEVNAKASLPVLPLEDHTAAGATLATTARTAVGITTRKSAGGGGAAADAAVPQDVMNWDRESTSFLCRATYSGANAAYDGGRAGSDATAVDGASVEGPGVPPVGVPQFHAVVRSSSAVPLLQPWVSLKFLFANASLLREVPFDPHLKFIEREQEEDALYSARAWAAGWDAYSPQKSVAFQWKGGAEVAGSLSDDVPSAQMIAGKRASFQRIQYLLHALHRGTSTPIVPDDVIAPDVIEEAARYGVRWNNALSTAARTPWRSQHSASTPVQELVPVDQRNLEQWFRFAGLNPRKYELGKQWC